MIRPVPYPKTESGAIYLHLGCGNINHPKFVNVDLHPAPHVHHIRGIDDLSIFHNQSVKMIYACHCLEHFPHQRLFRVLKEWHRVLVSNGVLRLSVPDFDLLLEIYRNSGNDIRTILGPLMGGQTDIRDFHKSIFTRRSLEDLLSKSGFTNIRKWRPEEDELTPGTDYSTFTISVNNRPYPVSLNLEANKIIP
jgi:predicted SAM-dependent methyltransferase